MSKIKDALKLADETKALLIGAGVLAEVANLFLEQFEGKRAVVVADENTYRIAGERVEAILKESNIVCLNPYVFSEDNLYAEYSYVEALIKSFAEHDAIPVAVGSGTINDLVKLASHKNERRYMCVATAASMDGYTAFGASITADGAKQTFSCPAPKACLADTTIIAQAPSKMTASGYADLFAKVTAGADWILADKLRVEAIDSKSWNIVQNGLQEALALPEETAQGDLKAIEALVEGLMLGGFAMQSHKSSRPASGAEHQFSHLWNMEHHTNNGEQISHGFQVAIGTLAITALYEEVFKTSFEDLDIDACCEAWPTAEELAITAREIFKNTDFPEIGYKETKAKYISRDELAEQLALLKANWADIKAELQKQIIPYAEVKKRLLEVGAPTMPEDIGLTRTYLRETFVRSQFIRCRFTILDLAVRTNMLESWLDNLFAKDGVLGK